VRPSKRTPNETAKRSPRHGLDWRQHCRQHWHQRAVLCRAVPCRVAAGSLIVFAPPLFLRCVRSRYAGRREKGGERQSGRRGGRCGRSSERTPSRRAGGRWHCDRQKVMRSITAIMGMCMAGCSAAALQQRCPFCSVIAIDRFRPDSGRASGSEGPVRACACVCVHLKRRRIYHSERKRVLCLIPDRYRYR
jgi:hypothetical protein